MVIQTFRSQNAYVGRLCLLMIWLVTFILEDFTTFKGRSQKSGESEQLKVSEVEMDMRNTGL